jgi:hypothetical protein
MTQKNTKEQKLLLMRPHHSKVVFKVLYIPANGVTDETFKKCMELLIAVGEGPSHPDCYDKALTNPGEKLFSQILQTNGLA